MTDQGSNGPEDRDQGPSSEWDSDEQLDFLKMERDVHGSASGGETDEVLTRRLLEQAAPLAASKIIHIAMHSGNDNTSLAAAKYITDLLLTGGSENGKAAWESLVGEVVSTAEIMANDSGS